MATTGSTHLKLTLIALALISGICEGALYTAYQPVGFPGGTYPSGSVAGIYPYEVINYQTFRKFSMNIEADLTETSFWIKKTDVVVPETLSSSITQTIPTGFGQVISVTKTINVQPFAVTMGWLEPRPLTGSGQTYFYSAHDIASYADGDSVVINYEVSGPTETVSGQVILEFAKTATFTGSSEYMETSLSLTNYPTSIRAFFGGFGFRFAVDLIGDTEIKVTVDNHEVELDLSGAVFFGMSSNETVLTLSEANVSLSLFASPTNSGTVTGSGTYLAGDIVTLSAEPNPGYKFNFWSDPFGTQEATFATILEESLTLSAHFIEDTDDDDNDGLSNYQEIVVYHTDPKNADSDGDLIPDLAEVMAGTDPNVSNAALVQLIAQLVANDPESFGVVEQLSADGEIVILKGMEEAIFRVQPRSRGTAGEWQDLGEPIEIPVAISDSMLFQLGCELSIRAE